MSEVLGKQFTNGPTCEGVAYTSPNAPMDMSVITIEGRYPSGRNDWSVFHDRYAQAVVLEGRGELLIKDGEAITIKQDDSVKIEAGTRYAWRSKGGDVLRFLMGVTPAFDDGKGYEVEKEL